MLDRRAGGSGHRHEAPSGGGRRGRAASVVEVGDSSVRSAPWSDTVAVRLHAKSFILCVREGGATTATTKVQETLY